MSDRKGKPTPKRKEAQAKLKVSSLSPAASKEAKKALKEQSRSRRLETRAAYMRGEESALPVRDKGPARRFVRNYVDERKSVTEYFLVFIMVILFLTVIIFQLVVKISAQSVSENVITLTKKAHKGYLQDAGMMSDGNIQITYKIAGDKKKNELFYEQYIIGKDLKLSDTKQISEPKVDSKPDREKIFF